MAGASWLMAMVLVATGFAVRGTAQAQQAPAQATSTQVPYTPPPAAGSRVVGVPPYPGYPPLVFASAAQAADYNSWRLEQLTARERGLTLLGHSGNYQAEHAAAFAVLVTGVGMIMGTWIFFAVKSDSGNLDDRSRIGLASAGLFGIGLTFGGAAWLMYLNRSNPYRAEIRALHRERAQVKDELYRARKQARAEPHLSFDLRRLQVKF